VTSTLSFSIVNEDILKAGADIIALKYADTFYGADKAVAAAIRYSSHLANGQHLFVNGSSLDAKEVLFVGVGPLPGFRYEEIRLFGKAVLEIATSERPGAVTLALTVHGPGYGLDEQEAFLSLMSGLRAAQPAPESQLRVVAIYERSASRAERLEQLIGGTEKFDVTNETVTKADSGSSRVIRLDDYGVRSETKHRLFVAMPFANDYLDEYEIAFTEAAHQNGFLCERLDVESFVGDVVCEIKSRILNANGVLALLNDHNPNVFLEIGFAMAHNKPIIFVVKKGNKVPFDVRGNRFLEYTSIYELRKTLISEIRNLKDRGILEKRGGDAMRA
jgi:hypothetical protein